MSFVIKEIMSSSISNILMTFCNQKATSFYYLNDNKEEPFYICSEHIPRVINAAQVKGDNLTLLPIQDDDEIREGEDRLCKQYVMKGRTLNE